jgi:hypothetical protein
MIHLITVGSHNTVLSEQFANSPTMTFKQGLNNVLAHLKVNRNDRENVVIEHNSIAYIRTEFDDVMKVVVDVTDKRNTEFLESLIRS